MTQSSNPFPEPKLPWSKDELSKKGISQETIEYHYGKHHLGYVRKLNDLAKTDKDLAKMKLEEIIKNRNGKAFNLAGQIWNHNFYWAGMSSKGGSTPTNGALLERMRKDFGSFNQFFDAFTTRAKNHFGSGWVWLAKDPKQNKLVICDGHDAHNPMRDGMMPLLTIDVWEHAYYIDHRNDKGSYIKVFMNCIDWNIIQERYSMCTCKNCNCEPCKCEKSEKSKKSENCKCEKCECDPCEC